MIRSYDLEDFKASFSIPGQFIIDRFEQIGKPEDMVWPHKHSFYQVLWIEKGLSNHVIDQHSFDLSSDFLFFIAPGQIHELNQSEDVKGYSIMFTEQFLSLGDSRQEVLMGLSFLENSYSQPAFKLAAESAAELTGALQLLRAELTRADRSEPILRHLLMTFLLQVQRIVAGDTRLEKDTFNVSVLKKFRKLIDLHYKKESRLGFFAEALFMTTANLNAAVKKMTGKTAGELIRERILLEAKRMLLHSPLTVGEIAAELGFKDFSYFSRQFKKQEGMSPAEFRKSGH